MTRKFTPSEIEEAALLLRRGEVMAIPTETVYGLAASLFVESALRHIFVLKNRPADNPLIVHASSIAMVESLVDTASPFFAPLASQFWPGPLTFILPRKSHVPSFVSAGRSTLAVRIPSHPVTRALIDRVGSPLAAPSANVSGRPSPTTAAHVLEDFEGKISAVLDGGPCEWGLESTVVSLLGPTPILLRPGSVQREDLEKVLGFSLLYPTSKDASLSPGMKYRHYAPRAKVHLLSDVSQVQGDFVLSRIPCAPFVHRPLEAPTLYAQLRQADQLQCTDIWVVLDPISLQNEALMDRLRRASE
jgi:L-threonylcarbamoyladenylate synthase